MKVVEGIHKEVTEYLGIEYDTGNSRSAAFQSMLSVESKVCSIF